MEITARQRSKDLIRFQIIHSVVTLAFGTEWAQNSLRKIGLLGRQMIITYGQSCKCDFTLTLSENETDNRPLLRERHMQIGKSVIRSAFHLRS